MKNFRQRWWLSRILTLFMLSKLFKTYFIVFGTLKNIDIDINIVIL